MGVITLAYMYLSLALPVVTLCYPADQWLHQIYVDNQTGVNNSSCWEGGYSTPCLSINLALTGAQHYNNSTIIHLQPGQHQLCKGSETQLRNMSQLAIVGNGNQGEVVIRCEPLAGLAFFWSQDIELRNVCLVGCGTIQNNISNPIEYIQIQIAVLFYNCNVTKLTNVHMNSSDNTGVVVYNPMGAVNITNCLFSLSGDQGGGGGGGLVIEVNKVSSQSSCIITNSTFTHNIQFGGFDRSFSVVFIGNATNNTVQLDGVRIENNTWGGVLLAFRDNTTGNTVQLDGVGIENNDGSGIMMTFTGNANGNTVTINGAEVMGNTGYIGGGVSIEIASDCLNKCPSGNTVTINSSRFILNVADFSGGGIAVQANDYSFVSPSNKVLIENCVFDNNYAVQRSLLYQSNVFNQYTTIHNSTIIPWHGVAFNNPYFIRAECTWQGWVVFIFLQLVPIWIMMILLTVLHINITNGGLNGYILFSQLVSLRFPGLASWAPPVFPPDVYVLSIPLIVYSIWNLNFLTLYPIPFCLPLVDTAAGVILLQYVIAACPLVFIIVTYTWIRWYKNSYRFVVYTTRPVHQLLARFWQKFKIQPSLIDTYPGLILLSWMRFLTVSVKLLQYIAIVVKTEDIMDCSNRKTLEHAALGIVAVLCILVFIVPPMVVLLFYHLKIFQQCLTWCKLDRPGLHVLVDAYQGCFKNRATDNTEARYFAGLYLLFRFCYLVLIVLPLTVYALYHDDGNYDYNEPVIQLEYIPLSASEACLSFVMAGLVILIRPYKKTARNVRNILIFFFLAVIGAPSFIRLVAAIFTFFGVIYLPFIVIFCYAIYRLVKHCCCACVALRRGNVHQATPSNGANSSFPTERQALLKPPATSMITLHDYREYDDSVDHMTNSSRYNTEDTL